MSSNTSTDRFATDRVLQTRGPLNPDGITAFRSEILNTTGGGAQKINAEDYISAKIPQVNTDNIKNGVFHGMVGDLSAGKGHRGLSSLQFNAMQDSALTGTSHLLSEERTRADGVDEVGDLEEQEQEQDAPNEDDDDDDAAAPYQATPDPSHQALPERKIKNGEERFTRAYVEAHPNENFTHMGKGSWRRGLPRPGDNTKSGVRGPGAARWKRDNTGRG